MTGRHKGVRVRVGVAIGVGANLDCPWDEFSFGLGVALGLESLFDRWSGLS